MLSELKIRNFAIIDDLHIRFFEGLTILSGETGAGKSIILNAVNLLLGSRASVDMIRSGAETAELEALFRVSADSTIAKRMSEYDDDAAEGLVVRRIISRSDSNRVYINNRLATIQMLNAVTENLASISGQHAHQSLLREEQHLLILDQYGNLLPQREAVGRAYNRLLPLLDRLQQLHNKKMRQSEHIELLSFQKDEIAQAAVFEGEDEQLEQERSRLKNIETLYRATFSGIESLYGMPGSVVERLAEVTKELEKCSMLDGALISKAEKLAATTYQIEDIVTELRDYLSSLSVDENSLEHVEDRLDLLNKLKRKYGGSLKSVLQALAAIENELAAVENLSAELQEVESQISMQHAKLSVLVETLSRKRQAVADKFAKNVIKELASLKMAGIQFRVALRHFSANEKTDPHLALNQRLISETGMDRATFIIAPNIGEELKPLTEIASGGELSRVVLALKAILAGTDSVETVVFDEVDAGIGGGVAEVVGKKLSELARHHQVICITHLPQIAKFGDNHYRISKQVSKGRTTTMIKMLSDAERQQEVARMLGGEKITQATLNHAKEMLKK